MADCTECGAALEHDESFCGNCGAQQRPTGAELKTVASGTDEVSLDPALADTETPDEAGNQAAPGKGSNAAHSGDFESAKRVSSSSLGGSATGGISVQHANTTRHTGTTGG